MGASSTSSSGGAAQRYAAALFDLANDAGELDGIETGLNSLASTINSSVELSKALSSPLYSIEEKKNVLDALSSKLGLSDLAIRFLGVVAENRRAGDLPEIIKAFAERLALHRGMTRVVARSAQELSAEQAKQLTSTVSAALGRDVDVELEVDPALIGGLQLRVGSRLIDASLRTKLDDLTNAMKGA